MDLQRLEQAVANVTCRYREAGYFPDAAVRVFNREKSLVTFCAGNAKDTSLFDVASLTKIATATMVLRLVEHGAFRLEDEIANLLPSIAAHPYLQARMKGITLEMLLTHTSTLTDWYPFYSRCREDFYETLAYALSHTEVTRGVVYSDLNFMILGKLLEETLRKPLSVCLQEELVQPLGLGDMMFCPQERERIIPADYGNAIEMNMCRERNISFDGFRPLGVPAPGMVNDGNSHYYFGDVAGHAGIYATTESYMRLCQYYMTTSSELLVRAQKEQPAEESVAESVQVRENLNETAFFYPTLTTDGKGEVNISFTLPESITTWRFMGFAHDSQMNNGMVTAETVAKKKVMIQPNMPRFLRHGDKAVVSAKVINTSEEALSGNAVIELIDPETEKVVYTQRRSFSVDADKTVAVSFDIPTAQLPEMMICRVKAVGNGYSDGEQHYLPMLPSAEMVTNTMGFTQNGPGTKTIDLTKLIDVNDASTKLTVEYTNNPTWLMVQALPSVATPNSNNAISLASAYYSNAIADNILHQSPEIKKVIEQWQQESGSETSLMSNLQKNEELKAVVLNETPWVMDATREADQKRQLINYFDEVAVNYRLNDQLSKLKQLQLGDGSFTWWPGMRGNIFVTTVVAQTLIRLNHMTGDNQKTEQMIAAAMKYMGTKAAEDVARMKKEISKGNKNPYPSEMSLDYLYCLAISGMEAKGISKSDIAFIEKQLSQKATDLTIYGKARSAIILSKSDYKMRAAEYLESLRQYTVYTEEMGRYFDTPRAHYSWRDYRIPSQVAAIEAVKMLTPADNKTLEEMQRWLLQEKRTQAWDTPVNSVDAVYAFLNGETSKLATDPSKASVLSVDGRQLTMPQATAGLGYVKTAIAGKDCRTFTAEKSSEGTSWGAVYAQFMQPSKDVKSSASGIAVTREIIPSDRSKKQLAVGDRVKVRITITADRDYDFVEVIDKRAACLEPIGQISGYHWGYYCTPRDNSTNYYFDCLAKGKHVVETEYYIDREGEYESGTCVAQCAYSPEYSGRDSGSVIKVSGAEE